MKDVSVYISWHFPFPQHRCLSNEMKYRFFTQFKISLRKIFTTFSQPLCSLNKPPNDLKICFPSRASFFFQVKTINMTIKTVLSWPRYLFSMGILGQILLSFKWAYYCHKSRDFKGAPPHVYKAKGEIDLAHRLQKETGTWKNEMMTVCDDYNTPLTDIPKTRWIDLLTKLICAGGVSTCSKSAWSRDLSPECWAHTNLTLQLLLMSPATMWKCDGWQKKDL